MDFLKPLSRFRGDICIDTIYIVLEIVCITFMMTKSKQWASMQLSNNLWNIFKFIGPR